MATAAESTDVKKVVETLVQSLKEVEERNNELLKAIGESKDESSETISQLKKQIEISVETNQKLKTNLEDSKIKEEIEQIKLEEKKEEDKERPGVTSPKLFSEKEAKLNYALKSQMLHNIEIQNAKLKSELALQERMDALKILGQTNKQLMSDMHISRVNSRKLLKAFEKKAKEAQEKMNEMAGELKYSQDLAKKYKELYENEKKQKQSPGPVLEGKTGSPHQSPLRPGTAASRPKSAISGRSGGKSSTLDIQIKYQSLIHENESLREEIRKLKEENSNLFQRAKESSNNLYYLKSQLATNFADRESLMKRLKKERGEKQQLMKSFRRQVRVNSESRRQEQLLDEEIRWSQMHPVDIMAAHKRTFSYPVIKAENAPRPIPVESWGSRDPTRPGGKYIRAGTE